MTANERQIDQIRKMLRDADAYGRAQDAYAKDKSLPRPDRNVVLEPLVPYVRGQQPVIFRADREAEIRGALRFADEMKLKPIILGGNDAGKVVNLLKEKNVPVILTGIFSLPAREDDGYDSFMKTRRNFSRPACVSAYPLAIPARKCEIWRNTPAWPRLSGCQRQTQSKQSRSILHKY